MNDNNSNQQSAVAKFRALHESGCFILPNPWDIGTALYLHHLRFEALATTSAGFDFSRGKPDGGVPLNEMLAHIGEIVAATPLPVNADFLNGFANDPEDVATNVRLCIATGVAGLSIEDSSGRTDTPLYKRIWRSIACAQHAVRLMLQEFRSYLRSA
jgi:2-methylisocitrate lyase-like PEP mutase family enzyme